jgi:MGT family glycosyltransferase
MRVLFCSFDSPGHLFPQVGLALEMRRRGHQVAFATGLPARGTLEPLGIERITRGTGDGGSFELTTWFVPLRTAIDVKHVEHAVRRFTPDVLVTQQLCQAPLIVGERQRIPVTVMGLLSYLWPVGQPVSPARFAACEPTHRWRLNEAARIMNEARELFRLPALETDVEDSPLLGDLFMLRTVPELEPELEAVPARVHAVGPCLWEPPRANGAWQALRGRFPRPEAPLLYVQQGRTFKSPGFWRHLVEALADRPVQVVASTGRMDQPVGDLPPNFLVDGHVPQGLVMPHARAVVSGGTTTVVLGALAHGLPSVVVPGGGETPDNAEKLVAAGCALSVEAEGLTAEAMRLAVEHVMGDEEMRRNCRRMQRAVAPAGGFGRGADLVERLAAGGVASASEAPRLAAV